MPAAKLTPLDREQVAATYAATDGDAAATAAQHGLTRHHVVVLAGRYQWPRRPSSVAAAAHAAVTSHKAQIISRQPTAVTAVTVTASQAISDLIQADKTASAALVHKLNRRALEAAERRKPLAIKTMRDLKDSAAIAEPDAVTGSTAVTVPIQINVG